MLIDLAPDLAYVSYVQMKIPTNNYNTGWEMPKIKCGIGLLEMKHYTLILQYD